MISVQVYKYVYKCIISMRGVIGDHRCIEQLIGGSTLGPDPSFHSALANRHHHHHHHQSSHQVCDQQIPGPSLCLHQHSPNNAMLYEGTIMVKTGVTDINVKYNVAVNVQCMILTQSASFTAHCPSPALLHDGIRKVGCF